MARQEKIKYPISVGIDDINQAFNLINPPDNSAENLNLHYSIEFVTNEITDRTRTSTNKLNDESKKLDAQSKIKLQGVVKKFGVKPVVDFLKEIEASKGNVLEKGALSRTESEMRPDSNNESRGNLRATQKTDDNRPARTRGRPANPEATVARLVQNYKSAASEFGKVDLSVDDRMSVARRINDSYYALKKRGYDVSRLGKANVRRKAKNFQIALERERKASRGLLEANGPM
jgi:hypothetical protein